MHNTDSPLHQFNNVSLLVTHYNRSRSLERLLQAFENLRCSFGEIIVSDDGSSNDHLSYIKQLLFRFNFTLVSTHANKGLGNNINKGQDAVSQPFTLYVQEDFEPSSGFPACFTNALSMMQHSPELDLVRFYAYFKYPYTKPVEHGFAQMIFRSSILYYNHLKFYVYSDHPHLRRSSFLQKFGRYAEGIKGDETEYRMAISFVKKKGKALLYNDFTTIFYQKNSSTEPSTMKRREWRSSKNGILLFIRAVYLKFKLVKWTLNFAFME